MIGHACKLDERVNLRSAKRENAKRHPTAFLQDATSELVTMEHSQTPSVTLRPARAVEVADLHRGAEDAIGLQLASLSEVMRVFRHDPSCFQAIVRGREIVGGAAFLYLNALGVQSLLSGSVDLRAPASRYLAARHESPEGIYWWAFFSEGVMRQLLPQLLALLASKRLKRADMYAIAMTRGGAHFMRFLGFEPARSTLPGLHLCVRSKTFEREELQ
jgi:hypothetical protein